MCSSPILHAFAVSEIYGIGAEKKKKEEKEQEKIR